MNARPLVLALALVLVLVEACASKAPAERLQESTSVRSAGAAAPDAASPLLLDTAEDAGPPAPPRAEARPLPIEIARQTDLRGFARGLAVHPGGRLIAMGSIGPPLSVWDGPSAKVLRSMERFGEVPFAFAFRGGELIAAEKSGELSAWVLESGAMRLRVRAVAPPVGAFAIDPAGARAAIGSAGGAITVVDLSSESIVAQKEFPASVLSLAWAPSGDRLAAGGGDGRVRVWDLASRADDLDGHTSNVVALAFLGPDRLISGAWDDTARIWNLLDHSSVVVRWDVPPKEAFDLPKSALTRRWRGHSRAAPYRARLVGHVERALAAQLDPATGVLTTIGGDSTLKRWNFATGALTASFGGDFEFGQPQLVAPDGRSVLSRRSDGVLIAWDVSAETPKKIFETRDRLCVFVKDGIKCAGEGGKTHRQIVPFGSSFLTLSDKGKVEVLGKELATTSYVLAVAVTPGGELVTADVHDKLTLWNASTGEKLRELPGYPRTRRIFASADYVATIDDSRNAHLGRLSGGGPTAEPKATAFPQESTPIFFAGNDRAWIAHEEGPGEIINLATGARVATIPGGRVSGFAAGDAETVVVAAEDGTLGVHRRADGAFVRRFSSMPSWLSALACNTKLCAAVHGDGSVRAFDLSSGKKLWRTKVHADAAAAIALSPDAKAIASGAWDGTVALLDAATGKVARRWTGTGPLEDLAFEPGGKWIVAGDDDRRVRRYDARSGLELPSLPANSSWTEAAAISAGGCTGVSSIPGAVTVWDLCTARLRTTIPADAPVTSVAISGDSIAIGDRRGKVRLATVDGDVRFEEKLFDREAASIAFSEDGSLVAAGEVGYHDAIKVLDVAAAKPIAAQVDRGGLASELVWVGRTVHWISRDGKLSAWSPPAAPRTIAELPGTSQIGFPVFSLAAGKNILVAGGFMPEVFIFDAAGKIRAKLPGHAPPAQVAFDGDRVVTLDEHGAAMSWTLAGKNRVVLPDVRELPGPASLAVGFPLLAQAAARGRVISGRWDGVLRLWDVEKNILLSGEQENCVPIATGFMGTKAIAAACDDGSWVVRKDRHNLTFISDARDWIAHTEDGYFDGSPGGGRLVALRKGTRVFGLDQVALDRNRPDLIFERFELGTGDDVAHLLERHRRRRERAGLGKDEAELAMPEVRIRELTQRGRRARLELEATAEHGLAGLGVWINGVPVIAFAAHPLSGAAATEAIELELDRGTSEVAVAVIDRRGHESLRAVEVARVEEATNPSLWVLAFGVSNYRDPALRLDWAHQDAIDLARAMESMRGFAKVHAKTFVDAKVTKESVREAKSALAGAKSEDTVVVFVAGHGATQRDAERTYYFLPHGADLADLPGTAIPFSAIEELLAEVAPRKRLLLLDTCESGDPEEDSGGAGGVLPGVKSRGLRKAGTKPPQLSERNRDRLIYVNWLERSGAAVLSSSRGGELSYESSATKHGLFTEALLEALAKPGAADRDRDGSLDVRELLQFIGPRVAKASAGRQHPALDRDNPAEKIRLFSPR